MTERCFNQFRSQYYDEFEEPRADHEEYCNLHERTVLILDETCLCRQRNIHCAQCIYDTNRLEVQLLWMLLDMIEDRDVGVRRLQS